MKPNELKVKLELHLKWLRGEKGGSRADLSGANLYGVNLSGADLSGADLSGANLSGANLYGAEWSKTTRWCAVTTILLASWGKVSKALCRDLMRYDAENHPTGDKKFRVWKKTGFCPYEDEVFPRVAHFYENSDHWRPGKAPSAYKLAMRLLKEKCVFVKDEE